MEDYEYTPLMNAVIDGDLDAVKLLVDMSPVEDINQKNNSGDTAFLLAAWYGYTPIAEYLASRGADINAEYPNGANALYVAVSFNSDDTIDEMTNYLLSLGVDPNKQIENTDDQDVSFEYAIQGDTPLLVAARRDNPYTVKVLLDYGANPNAKDSDGHTPLFYALSMNLINFEIVRILLEAGANPNEEINFEVYNSFERGGSYLFYLISLKEVELVKLFLDHGSDPNAVVDGETPLIYAIKLMEKAISVGAYYTKVYKMIFEIVKLLVDHGANVNKSDQNDKTPLVYSVIPSDFGNHRYQPRPELTKYLVDHGAIDFNDVVFDYSERNRLPYILYLVSKDDPIKIEGIVRYITTNNLQDNFCIQATISDDLSALMFAKNTFDVQFVDILTGRVRRLRDLTMNTHEDTKEIFNLRFQTPDVGDRYTLLSLSAFHNNRELTKYIYETVVNELDKKYINDEQTVTKEIFKYYIRQTSMGKIALQIAYERCNPNTFRYIYNILSIFSERVKNRIIVQYLTKAVPCESLMDVMDEIARIIV